MGDTLISGAVRSNHYWRGLNAVEREGEQRGEGTGLDSTEHKGIPKIEKHTSW